MERGIDLDLLKDLLKYISSKGPYVGEVFAIWGEDFSVALSDDGLEHFERSNGGGVGIRVLDEDGRMGFAHANTFDLNELRSLADEAINRLLISSPDPYRRIAIPFGAYSSPSIFDDTIFSLSESERVNFVNDFYNKAKGAHPLIERIRKTEYDDGWYEVALMNTLGMALKKRGTFFSCALVVLSSKGEEREIGYFAQEKRFLRDLNPDEVISNAVYKAVSLLCGKRVRTRKASLILSPEVTSDFISLFSTLTSAESVQKGKSLLVGKLGMKIASEVLTLVDDGTIDGGVGSSPFDGEGFPTRRKSLLDRGVLLTYLHNLYTASKDGVETTGNAVRGYASIPTVGVTNLFVLPGARSFEEILRDTKEGLYVMDVMGLHTVNLISGDFSLGVSGIWVDKGELAFPVKGVTIAGNLLDFFSRVNEVGNDLTFFGSTGGVTMKVEDVMIGGE